jgi:hypothetical protein
MFFFQPLHAFVQNPVGCTAKNFFGLPTGRSGFQLYYNGDEDEHFLGYAVYSHIFNSLPIDGQCSFLGIIAVTNPILT